MKKDRKIFITVKDLTFIAMLIAMSVAIAIVCKSYLNFGAGLFRVTFENITIILAGVLYGPIVGGITGLASDMIGYLLSGQTYPPNLIVSLGATMVGVISGLMARYVFKRRCSLQIILSGGLAHLIGSMIIKPIGLYEFYSWAVLWRIPLYLIIAPLEILLLCLLFKHSAVRKIVKEIDKEKRK